MEKPHKRLDVWQLSMNLVTEVYRVTGKFPSQETFVLAQQIRRAAVSIPSNISEGAARQSKREFIKFLHIAQGSLSELDTQLEIGVRLGYVKDIDFGIIDQVMERVDKMITGLIRQQKKD